MANKRIRQFPSVSTVTSETDRIAIDSSGGTYVNSITVADFMRGAGAAGFANTVRVSAPGSGYADARIASALEELADGDGPARLILGPGTYPLLGDIELRWDGDKDIHVTFDGATLDARGFTAPNFFNVLWFYRESAGGAGVGENGWRLESAVRAGDTSITGVPADIAAGLGDDCRGVLVFAAEQTGSLGHELGYGHGEQAVVWSASGTTVNLATFLREGYPAGTPVYAYRYPRVSIDGARILLDPSTQWSGIGMLGVMNPRITNSYVEGAQYVSYLIVQSVYGQIDNCLADTLGWEFFDGSVYGYGIGPSENFMLTNSVARRCKHALATSGSQPCWDLHVENCQLDTARTGVGCIGIRTHHSTRNLTLINVRTPGLSHVGSGRLTILGGEYTGGNKAMDGVTNMAIPGIFLGSQVVGSPHDINIVGATIDGGGYGGRSNAFLGIYFSESNSPQWFRRVSIDGCTIRNCTEGIRIIPSYLNHKIRIDHLSVTNCNIASNSYPISISDGAGPGYVGTVDGTTIVKKLDIIGGVLRNMDGSVCLNMEQSEPVEELTVDTDFQTGYLENIGNSLTTLDERSMDRFDAATNAAREAAGTKHARLDAIESTAGTSNVLKFFTGSMPATCATADSGTLLLTINLPSDWMEAAGTTIANYKYKLGTWSGTVTTGGKVGYVRRYSSDGTTCREQLPVTVHGGGGLMTVDEDLFAVGMVVTVDGFNYYEAST